MQGEDDLGLLSHFVKLSSSLHLFLIAQSPLVAALHNNFFTYCIPTIDTSAFESKISSLNSQIASLITEKSEFQAKSNRAEQKLEKTVSTLTINTLSRL